MAELDTGVRFRPTWGFLGAPLLNVVAKSAVATFQKHTHDRNASGSFQSGNQLVQAVVT